MTIDLQTIEAREQATVKRPPWIKIHSGMSGYDIDFIIHARADIRALIAEVRRLQEQIETMAALAGVPDPPVPTGSASDLSDPRIEAFSHHITECSFFCQVLLMWYKSAAELKRYRELAKVMEKLLEITACRFGESTTRYHRLFNRAADLLKEVEDAPQT